MKQAFVFSVYFFLLFLTFVLSAPNVVFILADDYGWNDIGFHGSSQVDTPVMDSMAEEGVILNNYYVIPLCTPSRASIMTGRHPVRLGLQHSVIIAGQRLGLPLEYKILPQYLNEMGYESHAIGKWHLGFFHRKLDTFSCSAHTSKYQLHLINLEEKSYTRRVSFLTFPCQLHVSKNCPTFHFEKFYHKIIAILLIK